MNRLILVDFDGTLTRRDTIRDLLAILARQRPSRILPSLPWIIAMLFARGRPERLQEAKCRAIGCLLKGISANSLESVLVNYRQTVGRMLRPAVLARIRDQQHLGAKVIVVTASPRVAVEAVMAEHDIPVIGTEFSVVADRFTGALDHLPCYGEHKVGAIRQWLARSCLTGQITEAWSDQLSDMPMMKLADRRIWVVDDARCGEEIIALDPQSEIFIDLRASARERAQ